jgi:Dockerin type I domain
LEDDLLRNNVFSQVTGKAFLPPLLFAAFLLSAGLPALQAQPFAINLIPSLPAPVLTAGQLAVPTFFTSTAPVNIVNLRYQRQNGSEIIVFAGSAVSPAGQNVFGGPAGATIPSSAVNGIYQLTSVFAMNTLGQTINIVSPSPLPNATFTIAFPPPLSLTQYSSATNIVSTSVFDDFSFTIQTGSALSTSTLKLTDPNNTPVNLTVTQTSFNAATNTATATARLNGNDATLLNGNYIVSQLALSNTGGQTLTLAAGAFPGGPPSSVRLSRCLPESPVAQPASGFDVTAPTVSCLAFPVSGIDVTNNSRIVYVSMNVRDDLSGIVSPGEDGNVAFSQSLVSPAGVTYNFPSAVASGPGLRRNIMMQFTIPRYAAAGVYPLTLSLQDLVGNIRTITSANLANLGFPNQVQVADSDQDTTPPLVTSIRFLPNTLTTPNEQNPVEVRLAIQDFKSGINGNYFCLNLRHVALDFVQIECPTLTLLSGPIDNGLWSGTFNFFRFEPSGTYTLDGLIGRDLAGNQTSLSAAEAQAIGQTVTVFANPSENQRPRLLSFDFNPKRINTSSGSQTVTMTSSWSDDISGFNYGPDVKFVAENQAILTSNPSDCALVSSGNVGYTYPRSVTYQCTVTFPKYAPPGEWRVQLVEIADTSNFNSIAPADLDIQPNQAANLEAAGFPTRLLNLNAVLSAAGSLGSVGGTVSLPGNPLVTLTAPPSVLADGTIVALGVSTNTANLPVPQGYSGAGIDIITVDLTPKPTSALPAPGLTLKVPTQTTLPPGTSLVLFRIDPTSGNLIPSPSAFGGTVTGTVDASGNSVTFTGITYFSSAVAFRRNTEVLGDINGDSFVNCLDVSILKASFGRRPGQAGFDARADLNRDGLVDIRDLTLLTRQLAPGTVCP